MAANKEFLTDILDGVLAVQQFLNEGLSKESLSFGCEAQRKNALVTLETLAKKIQSSHPSIRPRVNTPGKLNKPGSAGVKVPPPIQEDEELYEDPTVDDSQHASNYLSFYPPSSVPVDAEESGEEQEMYEAMEAGQQKEDAAEDDQAENYEDPVMSRPNNISSSSLPPPFQPPAPPAIHQILEEGEYATTTGMGPAGGEQLEDSMAMDWGNVYTTPPKGEKLKVSALKNVKIKGPLEKLGGRNHKTWQKRYCVLAGPLMYFYEKESSKGYNNTIAVTTFTASLAPNITDTKKHFGFKLTHEDKNTGKHKDYYFRTTSTELRDKWLSCVQNAECATLIPPSSPRNVGAIATLPRNMGSSQSPAVLALPLIGNRKRALSLGEVHQEEEEGELYEDMAVTEEEDKIKEESDEDADDEYVAVDPGQDEYVDVVPQDDVEQEEYEDLSSLQPPPPQSPPPGPPSDVFFPPSTQPKAASRSPAPRVSAPKAPAPKAPVPPPSEPEEDTNIYTGSDIPLDKVFVSQWDFSAGEADELRLRRGDLVYVSKPLDSELWWYGELLDAKASNKVGPTGFFPKEYSTLAFEVVAS